MSTEGRVFLEERIDQPATDSPSPVGQWLEGILRELTENSVTFEFDIRREMTNPFGVLHGGMIGAIADDVIGTAVFGCCSVDSFSSVNLSIDFVSTVNEGDTVHATGTVLREGSRMIYAECEIVNETGHRVARATSNIVKVGNERS